MSPWTTTAVVAAFLLAAAAGATAHHSIVGQFDVSRTVTLRGTIVKVDWINPHAYIHLNVTEAPGRSASWAISTPPIAMLRKAGITRESLAGKPGEVVTVVAHPALNGRPMAWISRITYADGHFYALGE